MDVKIRRESAADAAEISAVTRAAFLEAPYRSGTEAFIVEALRDAGMLSVSLVAEHEGKVVGHVAVSPVSISDGTPGWYGLGPISVLPEFQQRGIGSRLMEEALAALRELRASGCVLLGEPEYYGRFGFRAEPSLVLPGVPPEYFQALPLSGPLPHGVVQYHESFSQ
ncbi:N-acetyltransferase [Geomonas sp. RF6]|uniref:GNAT family N-acetyltransferase n=1 Tax=Geomonas sp. RF6 TaxID=2897342 RepID=UPI001E2EF1E8|nr:N-acetyltransferase [Geomonas sp. RF6]UFS71697.1 N-acetyltransferase [Geomonas sp. RF6]